MSERGAAPVAGAQIPLGQLAAVHAALAEHFELERALAVEGLGAAEWAEADRAWKLRLATEPATMEQYRVELAAHQDRLARPVSPIDGEIQQWTLFLRCYQLADDPYALLGALGLGLNDLARLQRGWARRIDEEPDLQKRAATAARKLDERMRKGERLAPPAVRVGVAELKPSAAARGAKAVAEPPVAVRAATLKSPDALVGLDRYAALSVALEREPRRRAELLREHGLTSDEADAAKADWSARFAADPQLRADYRALRAHYASRKKSSGSAEPAPAQRARRADDQASPRAAAWIPQPSASAIAAPRNDPPVVVTPTAPPSFSCAPPGGGGPATHETRLAGAAFPAGRHHAAGCPDVRAPAPTSASGGSAAAAFSPGATPLVVAPHPSPVVSSKVGPSGPTQDLDSTAQLVGPVLVLAPLPFRPAELLADGGASSSPGSAAEDLDSTAQLSGVVPAATPLPFRPPSEPPAASPARDAALSAAKSAVPEFDIIPMPGGTVEVRVRRPSGPALPFSSKRDPASTPPAAAVVPTKKVDPLDSTMMFRSRPGALVAPREQTPAPSAPTPSAAARASAPRERGPAIVALPLTKVEQLASFHAELIVKPTEKEQVRRRYGVAEPGVEAYVEAHWRARLARNSTEQRRYLELLEQYVDWLRSNEKR